MDNVIETAMKRIVFGAIVVVIAIVVLVAGIVAATAQDSALHQSMYDTDTDTGTNSNATKNVSGHASETDARSLIAGGCLFLILIAIVVVAMYITREKK